MMWLNCDKASGNVSTAIPADPVEDDLAARIRVDGGYSFEFLPDAYAPDRDYDGRFGEADYQHHDYLRIGDFNSKEKSWCARELEKRAARGRIDFWVRNLAWKPQCSFYLQAAESFFNAIYLR